MHDQAIQCGGFVARVRYDGYIYGSTYYVISAVVESLGDAQSKADEIRATVARERPTWHASSDEVRLLSSDWRGNPVRIELSYTVTESEA